MDSITTMTAKQYRLREWAAQIRDCRNRPAGVSMEEWCSQQGITKANYYYRLRRVREACLEGSRLQTFMSRLPWRIPWGDLLMRQTASSLP